MYGCEVWGFSNLETIERAHTKFCKSLLHLRRSSANYFCYGELGRRPLKTLIMARIIKYWLKLTTVKKDTLMYKVYKFMYGATENNTAVNWATSVKHLLGNLGFYDVWLQQGVGDVNKFMMICKQRLNDQYLQEWNNIVDNSGDGTLYKHIKRELVYSEYLNIINIAKYRYSFARFVTRNHKLTIITERWARGRPYPERVCPECNILDDEFHCVLECTKYLDWRRKYIKKYYYRRPSMLKFVQLLTSADKKTIQGLAMFLNKGGIC